MYAIWYYARHQFEITQTESMQEAIVTKRCCKKQYLDEALNGHAANASAISTFKQTHRRYTLPLHSMEFHHSMTKKGHNECYTAGFVVITILITVFVVSINARALT